MGKLLPLNDVKHQLNLQAEQEINKSVQLNPIVEPLTTAPPNGINNLRIIEKLDTSELLTELNANKEFRHQICHIKEIGNWVLQSVGTSKSPKSVPNSPKYDIPKS